MKSYDEVYSREDFYWGLKPNSLCREVTEFLTRDFHGDKSLIDLGSGEGRDLIEFARNGIEVTGVEISGPGISKAMEWAKRENLEIELIQSDLNNLRLDRVYDVIYSSGTLTFLRPENHGKAIKDYKAHTAPGGLNAFNVFIEKPSIETPPDWGDEEYYFRDGELAGYYSDWKLIKTTSETFGCDSGGKPHMHAMETLIARKW